MAHKTPTLIQPRIRSAVRAQSMSLDSSVDTRWRHREVGLNTQSDTPAINACVDTFISRLWSEKNPSQAYSLGSKFELYFEQQKYVEFLD